MPSTQPSALLGSFLAAYPVPLQESECSKAWKRNIIGACPNSASQGTPHDSPTLISVGRQLIQHD